MSPARLALYLTLAGGLALVGLVNLTGAGWVDVLSVVFVVLPVAAWLAAAVLYLAHRREPTARNLAERSVVAIRDGVVATLGAALGINRLAELHFPTDVALGLLSLSLLLVTAYPLAWLIQWLRGRWD